MRKKVIQHILFNELLPAGVAKVVYCLDLYEDLK
jgi:hypothetical protein